MKKFAAFFIVLIIFLSFFVRVTIEPDQRQIRMRSLYAENVEITDTYDSDATAKCYNGTFVGKNNDGVVAYKGIPFAEPPVGQLRWKSPVAAKESNQTYSAYYYGKAPIQVEKGSMAGPYYEKGEDCLTLNLWTNTTNLSMDKPVMVYLHGGSYTNGATADPLFEGHNYVKKYDDVIFVSVGYRTGIMGFIDFSSVEGGEDYDTSGNLGLLDQVCALQWIQDNISAFGGNPDNITLVGESAGGGSASLLPFIEGTEGLFHRAIIQSGSIYLTYTTEECQPLTQKLLKKTGCTNMAELTQLSEEELFKACQRLNGIGNFPERDGVVLPKDFPYSYGDGKRADINMLIGTNAQETRFWMNESEYYTYVLNGKAVFEIGLPIMYESNLKEMSPEDRQSVHKFIQMQTDEKTWNLSELYNEILFRVPAITQASAHADSGGKTYMYYWNYPGKNSMLGAFHSLELPYTFNNLHETMHIGSNVNMDLANTVQDMWVNFARTGNPSTNEYAWQEYETDKRMTMVLGENVMLQEDLKGEQRKLIEPLMKYNFNGSFSRMSLNVPQVYKIAFAAIGIILAAVLTPIAIGKLVKKIKNKLSKRSISTTVSSTRS